MPDVRIAVASDDPRAPIGLADDLSRARLATKPATGAGRPGDKSTAAYLAELVLTGGLAVATVEAAANVIVAFVERQAARRVTVRVGDTEVVVEGASARDARRAVQAALTKALEAESD